MKLKLKDIHPNPFRDMDIDPINPDSVKSLKQSINDHEFWNGLLVRKSGKEYQLVFGHHRHAAAMEAGIEEFEVPIVDWTDDEMVRAMAAENATQRATNFSACANDVAAAMRVLGFSMLTNDTSPDGYRKFFRKPLSFENCKARFIAGTGLGIDILNRYFEERLPVGVLREVIAELKESGKFAEIVNEVFDHAATEGHVYPAPDLEESEPTFDMAVGQVFTNTSHLAAFRGAVSNKIAKEILPVSGQVKLAQTIKDEIEEAQAFISAVKIKEGVNNAVMNAQGIRTEQKKELEKGNKRLQAKHQWGYARNKLAHAHGHIRKLIDLLDDDIVPDDFDSELARAFFANEFPQFIESMNKVQQLLPITIPTFATTIGHVGDK